MTISIVYVSKPFLSTAITTIYASSPQRWMYLDVSNFLEVSTYVTAIATVLPLNGGITGESDVQWATGVISLLLAYGVMLVQLQL